MTRPPDAQLTHLGLYVRDLDAMVAFYAGLLGMVVTDSGELRGGRITFMSRSPNEHHQLVMVSGRPDEDYSPISQMSFRVNTLEDLQHYNRAVAQMGLRDLRPSNHGNAWSIYFLDPEGNRVEIYATSPWYVSQPYQQPLDLDAPADEIRASTKAMVSGDASFQPREAWQRALSERLAG
ncbi:VOC family protein [Hydrogenophaga sp. 2FB]|uniref:VOC family protein n=1 Tax=Hydrogenophaga sp. 2FB TaxID=2502187 RepID=UPI0010FA4657|nr:VOC family protein [Hydrogenophaga sp. 2FB]